MLARTLHALALLTLAGVAACASPPDVRLAPALQDAELREGDVMAARVVVAYLGVYERDGAPELGFRVRVENPRNEPFALAPAQVELLDAALLPLTPLGLEQIPREVPPHGDVTFDVGFAAPRGTELAQLDLGLVSLRLRFQNGRWSWNPTLRRYEVGYAYAPYYGGWYAPYSVHAGVVLHP